MTKKCIAHLPIQKYEKAQIWTRLAAVWAIRGHPVTIVTVLFGFSVDEITNIKNKRKQ